VFQLGEIVIFVGYFFEDALFHFVPVMGVCDGEYSKYVFFCSDFLVE